MAASTLVITPGSASANAYCDVTFADQYQADRPAVGTTWSLATPDTKAAAILWATKLLDRLWEWEGYVTSVDQALLWPRQGILKLNGLAYIDEHTIPLELEQATAEYARQLLASDLAGNSQIETFGITSLRAGPVSFTFKDAVMAKPVPDTVVSLIPFTWGHLRSRNTGVRRLLRA